jgi:protease II
MLLDAVANLSLPRGDMGTGHLGKSGRYDALHEPAEQHASVFACLGVAANGDPAVERSIASS